MILSTAQDFTVISNGILDLGRALIGLVQNLIDIATADRSGRGGYPFS
ncbi:hypothetical protein [Nocardia bovistercoris]|uniref:Uncharacterized protein n=1 Tax=Nocardia bovistercoris TaxID=2785916 RepID=A0A931IIM9_9NOCA|nr:hypothetical protein [Nocardia bovistercoris]MBH0780303.1 hypothetical protein [Nocardia bovistercoris]